MADDFTANTLTTGRVAIGASTTGTIETAGDLDWFAVALDAGKSYTFTVEGNTLADPFLRLLNVSGTTTTEIATNDDAADLSAPIVPIVLGLNSEIDITISASGTYYLEVSSSPTSTGGPTGTYTVSAANTVGSVPVADDYPASAATTGRVVPGSSATGQLEIDGDKDWFAIDLVAGKAYTFNLDAGATNGVADSVLTLYDKNGNVITSNDDANGSTNSEITYVATATSTYYLEASSHNSVGTGSYKLSATLPLADDFSNNVTTTGHVTPGSSTSGKLEYSGDKDWFAVSLVAGHQYTFNLDSDGTATGLSDPFLTLYDTNGVTVRAYDDDTNGLNSQITYTALTTGTYYLEASAPTTKGEPTGGYVVSCSLPSVNGLTLVPAGTSGNDTISGTAGNDLINGGAGIDTAAYSGNRGDFTITHKSDGTYQVADNAGAQGTDVLNNIEKVRFADQTIDLPAERMEKMFIAYYGRPGDPGGTGYWQDTLAGAFKGDESQLVWNFGNHTQTEFVNLYGSSADPGTFISNVYQNLFNHAPDPAGLVYWKGVYDQYVGQGQDTETVRGKIVAWIMDGAQDANGFADLTTLNNKVLAACNFTVAIDTPSEVSVYGNLANAGSLSYARDWLQQIGSDTAATANAVDPAALDGTLATLVGLAGS